MSHCTRQGSNLQPYDPKSYNGAGELARMSKESLDLARALGEPGILEIAEGAAARVRNQCPVEAAAAGL
jgi:hypothetical protein